MAEQAVDVRSTMTLLRRHVRIVACVALIGALLGGTYAFTHPPMYTSTSMVLLPTEKDPSGQPTVRDTDTVSRVAASDVVLAPVAQKWGISTTALHDRLSVSAPTPDLVRFEARAATPQEARDLSAAVAASEVTYLQDAASSLTAAQRDALNGRISTLQTDLDTVNAEIEKAKTRAQVEAPSSVEGRADATALSRLTAEQADLALQIDRVKEDLSGTDTSADAQVVETTPARRPGVVMHVVKYQVLGVVAAVLAVATLLVLFRRRDKRLRLRDEIADAIGCPVVASATGRQPRTVAGWTSLLTDHTPTAVEAWSFRQSLHLMAESGAGTPDSITVVTIADDARALSLGPQLAAYCAGTGLRTRLVAARGHELAAPLWAACAQASAGEPIRAGLVVDTRTVQDGDDDIAVVLAVVDRAAPDLHHLPQTAVTVLAVSAGTSTADDLARLAVAADDYDRRINWLVVVDPDDLDKTTGRLLERERMRQPTLPTRITGSPNPALEIVHENQRRKEQK